VSNLMSSMKHKLRLAGALAVLATLALAASCRGFFQNPTLTSIAIAPTAPQVQLGTTTQLQVFGTFNDGSRNQVKTGIAWSSSAPTVASIGQTSGVLTGVQVGTATITADAQGLSSTATATVFLSGVTAITVTPNTGSVSILGTTVADFKASATANGISVDITGNGATWTITPTSSTVTCTFVSPNEQCSATTNSTTGTYTITVGYPGTTVVGTATLTVNP
jgi:Big-like domain-containing protein